MEQLNNKMLYFTESMIRETDHWYTMLSALCTIEELETSGFDNPKDFTIIGTFGFDFSAYKDGRFKTYLAKKLGMDVQTYRNHIKELGLKKEYEIHIKDEPYLRLNATVVKVLLYFLIKYKLEHNVNCRECDSIAKTALLLALECNKDTEGKGWGVGIRRIAAKTRLSEKTVLNAVNVLEEGHILKIAKKGGLKENIFGRYEKVSNEYIINKDMDSYSELLADILGENPELRINKPWIEDDAEEKDTNTAISIENSSVSQLKAQQMKDIESYKNAAPTIIKVSGRR